MINRVVIALAALALATPAHAQATVDPEHIAALLKDAGYPTEFVGEQAGYRQILTKSGDYDFSVELYDCNAGKACELLLLRTTFRKSDSVTKEAVDAYSSQQPQGRMFLDRRGNPAIELEFDLTKSSLTDAQFTDALKSWDTMLVNYAGFLRGDSPPAPAAAAAAGNAAPAPSSGGAS